MAVAKIKKKITVVSSEKVNPVKLLSVIDPAEEARTGLTTSLKLMISALTLVSALAWNEAVKALFTYLQGFLPKGSGELAQLFALFMYALVVTAITVFVINRLEKIRKKVEVEVEEEKPQEKKAKTTKKTAKKKEA